MMMTALRKCKNNNLTTCCWQANSHTHPWNQNRLRKSCEKSVKSAEEFETDSIRLKSQDFFKMILWKKSFFFFLKISVEAKKDGFASGNRSVALRFPADSARQPGPPAQLAVVRPRGCPPWWCRPLPGGKTYQTSYFVQLQLNELAWQGF